MIQRANQDWSKMESITRMLEQKGMLLQRRKNLQNQIDKNSSNISRISSKLGLIDAYNPSLRGSVENNKLFKD
jgi:hypothetical protein